MLRDERTRRQEVLEERIKVMAKNILEEIDIGIIAIELRDAVYDEGFEHCTPELFTLISEIFKEDNDYSLDFLSENIIQLRDYIEKDYITGIKEFESIAEHVDKLCDYVNLEIGRLNYYLIDNSKIKDLDTRISTVDTAVSQTSDNFKDLDEKISRLDAEVTQTDEKTKSLDTKISELDISINQTDGKIGDLDTEISSLDADVNQAVEKTEKLNKFYDGMKEKVESLQRDSITILGIFASIVLTFTGGMIFSSSVLENIGNASAYRIIIIALIIGLVIINSVISLIMYMGKIIRFKDERRKGIKEWFSGNIYWVSINVIFITLVVITYIGWLNSTEKALLDESNRYQIEMHHKNTDELIGNSNSVSDNSSVE